MEPVGSLPCPQEPASPRYCVTLHKKLFFFYSEEEFAPQTTGPAMISRRNKIPQK
jgi:hypothetical protein